MKHNELNKSNIKALHKYLSYNYKTGALIWKPRKPSDFETLSAYNSWTTRFANQVVRSNMIIVDGAPTTTTGRAIYALHTGKDAGYNVISFIDGDRYNRRWKNIVAHRYSDLAKIERPNENVTELSNLREFLAECFTYNARTGELRWNHRPEHHFKSPGAHKLFNTRFAGKSAGTLQSRDGRYQVHMGSANLHLYNTRIIWILQTGEDPKGMVVDHIDGNPRNNKWNNLRLLTQSQNSQNAERKTSDSGIRGVYKTASGTWRMRFACKATTVDKIYKTKKEAIAVRAELVEKYYGEFTRKRSLETARQRKREMRASLI